MLWKNSGDRYGVVAQGFHWLIVLLIIPGGLASLVIKIRDWYVGVILRRDGIDPDDATTPPAPGRPATAPADIDASTQSNGADPPPTGDDDAVDVDDRAAVERSTT